MRLYVGNLWYGTDDAEVDGALTVNQVRPRYKSHGSRGGGGGGFRGGCGRY